MFFVKTSEKFIQLRVVGFMQTFFTRLLTSEKIRPNSQVYHVGALGMLEDYETSEYLSIYNARYLIHDTK